MNTSHLMSGLLVLAAILLDLVVLTGFDTGYEIPLMLFLGLALGQLALLAYWCAQGKRTWAPRLLAVVAAAMLLSRPLGRVTAGEASEWFWLLSLFVACVGSTTRVAIRRAECRRVRAPERLATSQPVRRRTQFSLGSLLALMTVVGLGLGYGRHATFLPDHALSAAFCGFWLISVALTGLWAMQSHQAVIIRVSILAMLCIVAGLMMAHTERVAGVWFFTMIGLIEAGMICFGITITQTQQPAGASIPKRFVRETGQDSAMVGARLSERGTPAQGS